MDDLERRFTHYDVYSGELNVKLGRVEYAFLSFARKMVVLLPEGRELSLLLTKLEEAQSWATRALDPR